jgi:hypothetical protein
MEVGSMALVFRPARADELQRAEELVVRSINDLTERHGFGSIAILRPPDFQSFSPSNVLESSLPRQFCPDHIIATPGYDFRERQEAEILMLRH